MRVLVCGGRDYTNSKAVFETLNTLNLDGKQDCLISGGAKGADRLAEKYAEDWNIPILVFEADWETYGKRAGYFRNKQMLDEGKPDLVIAFPGGKGTAMMVRIAKAAGIEIVEIE
jgi:hypothetical protein